MVGRGMGVRVRVWRWCAARRVVNAVWSRYDHRRATRRAGRGGRGSSIGSGFFGGLLLFEANDDIQTDRNQTLVLFHENERRHSGE